MTTNSFDITLSTRTLQFVLPKMNTAYHTYNMILRILGLKFSIVLYVFKLLASLKSNSFFEIFQSFAKREKRIQFSLCHFFFGLGFFWPGFFVVPIQPLKKLLFSLVPGPSPPPPPPPPTS